MITRRAFGSLAFAGAFASAMKPLKGFAAESPCRLRIGVLSDIHVPTMESAEPFRKALKWFDKQQVDGVIIAGDLGFHGLIKEKLFVTGNHDVDGYFYHRPGRSRGFVPRGRFLKRSRSRRRLVPSRGSSAGFRTRRE